MIIAKNVTRKFMMGEVEVNALRGVNLKIKETEFVAIMGPSGSGKSTLMYLLGLIDQPSKGIITIRGADTTKFNQAERTRFRLENFGFVFQFYSLLQELSAMENVIVPHMLEGKPEVEAKKEAAEILTMLGLQERMHHYPTQLSGGEQQRVSIARALINKPEIVLADEPTANLDTTAGMQVVKTLRDLKKLGKTIVMVTHEEHFGRLADRTIYLKDGVVVRERKNRR